MSLYKKYFQKVLTEDGPNYSAYVPNTAGRGGALGNANSIQTGLHQVLPEQTLTPVEITEYRHQYLAV